MNKEKLLKRLAELQLVDDTEYVHTSADKALLEFIGDKEITSAFEDLPKWYA